MPKDGGKSDSCMASSAPMPPPVAPEHPHPVTLHGDTRVDDYFWLRERQNPEVIAYLEAENAYTDAVMAEDLAGLVRALGFERVSIVAHDFGATWANL